MPWLDLLVALGSLSLCSCTTISSDQGSTENTTPLYMSATTFEESKCTKPPAVENAYLLGDWENATYAQGHTASYICQPGFSVVGRIKMLCLKGTWTKQSSHNCRKKSCGNPGDTPFGTFKLIQGDSFEFGAEVEYSCDDGYQMMSKQTTRICAADGWTNERPHCEARLCPPVMDDSVIVVSNVNDGEYTTGHVIRFKCKNQGHKLKGPSSISCTSNGTWTMNPPTCKERCNIQESDLKKHNIRLIHNRGHYEDDDVQFQCVSGYNISDAAKLTTQCNSGILKYPTCHKIVNTTCGKPPCIPHGDITTRRSDSYPSGSSVKYQCPHLYRLKGQQVIRCQGGIWEVPPTCLEPCTIQEKDMRKNNVRQTHNRKHFGDGEDVQFECDSGYEISDPTKLTSQCNGAILEYPTCYKTELCTIQQSVLKKHNIRLKDNRGRFEDKEDVLFECVSGYNISDPEKLTPQCNSGILKYPTCHKIGNTCGRPPNILNGKISMFVRNSYPSGSLLKYQCSNFYKLQGPPLIRCQHGIWSDPPTCLGPCTVQENELKNHNIRLIGKRRPFREHEDVRFQCVSGYKVSSSAELTIHCHGGVLHYPTCHKKESCIVQESDLKEHNIQLKNNQRHFEDKEDVQFECVSGSDISDPAKLTIKCNHSVLIYPTCHKLTGCEDQQLQDAVKHQSVNKSCGRPPSILHGEITSAVMDTYPSGSTVKYQCPLLYKLQGHKVIGCHGGIWDEPPICLEPCTARAENMIKNHITVIWDHSKKLCDRNTERRKHVKKCYVPHDDTIKFACQHGYKISDPEDLKRKCNKGILTYPKCFKISSVGYLDPESN